MSILSGIGQIPSIFGSGGTPTFGGLTLVGSYQPATNIDVLTTFSSIYQTPVLSAGSYLIVSGLSFEIADATTVIEYLTFDFYTTITIPPSVAFPVINNTLLYNTTSNGKDYYWFNVSILTIPTLSPPQTSRIYAQPAVSQTGNIGGFNILASNQTDGSAGIQIYEITNPIL